MLRWIEIESPKFSKKFLCPILSDCWFLCLRLSIEYFFRFRLGSSQSSGCFNHNRNTHIMKTNITRVNNPMASRIAIGQLCATANLTRNLGVVTSLISRALDNDVSLIFFPEATDYISQNAAHSRKLAQETPKFISRLQQEIKSLMSKSTKKIDVSIGVHLPSTGLELQKGDDRVKNVLLYIDHRGEILHTYQKMHLFDVDVPNGPILKESRSVQPGKTIPDIIDTPVGKLGTEICYDVRFPELSLNLREKGAQILCLDRKSTR